MPDPYPNCTQHAEAIATLKEVTRGIIARQDSTERNSEAMYGKLTELQLLVASGFSKQEAILSNITKSKTFWEGLAQGVVSPLITTAVLGIVFLLATHKIPAI